MRYPSTHRQEGVSLVEVLVSLVIVSVGLLGAAGLMSASLKNTNGSYYRSQATVLVDDILDRMRANASAARNGEYDIDFGGDCKDTNPMAKTDCDEWIATVSQTLPGGEARVAVDAGAASNGMATVEIKWEGDSTFTTKSRL